MGLIGKGNLIVENDAHIKGGLIVEGEATFNGTQLPRIKVFNKTYSNVAITTRSSSGAYYAGTGETPLWNLLGKSSANDILPLSISLINWTGCAAVPSPYLRTDQSTGFCADISMTAATIEVKYAYIDYT